MNAERVSPELREWVDTQLAAGQPAQALMRAMLDSGWSHAVALAALEGGTPLAGDARPGGGISRPSRRGPVCSRGPKTGGGSR